MSITPERDGSSFRPVARDAATTEALIDLLNRYAEVGVEHFVLALDFADLDAITDVVEHIAAEIKPNV